MSGTICNDGTDLAGLSTPTRNRYFYGKLLDVFHFDLEQTYINRKRWLINRLGLGSGVLCGLTVVPSNDGTGLVIGPGVAIDPYGREIVVPGSSPVVDPRQPTDACGASSGDPVAEGTVVTICLAYHECEAEQVPAMVCDCDGQNGCQSSSIRERYMVLVQDQAAAPIALGCDIPDLYQANQNGPGFTVSYPPLVDRISASCPDPASDCVTLAQVTVPAAGAAVTTDMIDQTVRPIVYNNELLFEMVECLAAQSGGGDGPGQPPPTLTHIKRINWPHDGTRTYATFRKGLTVTFDAAVGAPSNGRAWFLVSVEYPAGEPTDGPIPRGTILVQRVLDQDIVWSADATSVTFTPDQEFEETFRATQKLSGQPILCRVVVKCDFLKDEQGMAVDGDHLLGSLPTGDGVPGGDFESWFVLK